VSERESISDGDVLAALDRVSGSRMRAINANGDICGAFTKATVS